MQTSEIIQAVTTRVNAVKWGNQFAVTEAALDALFSCCTGLDMRSKVECAAMTGVIAGLVIDSGPQHFLKRFETEVLPLIQP